jgi:Undecaprenyl-phosphate glucose phosphotransferase
VGAFLARIRSAPLQTPGAGLVDRIDWVGTGGTPSFTGAAASFPDIAEQRSTGNRVAGWLRAKRIAVSAKVAVDILRAVDCCAAVATGWLAFLLYPRVDLLAWPAHGFVALLGGVLLVNVLQMQGAYHPDRIRQPLSHLAATGGAVLVTAAILIAVAFVTKASAQYSRGWALLWLALALGAIAGVRLMLYLVLLRLRPTAAGGWLRRDVAIVGAGPDAERFIEHLVQTDSQAIRIVGVYDDRYRELPSVTGGYPVRGAIADLSALCRTISVDKIYVAIPWSAEDALRDCLNQLQCLPVDIRLVVAPLGYHLLDRRVSYLHRLPMIHVADRPLGDWGRLAKWIEDAVVATVALAMLGPLMLLIAIAIKIDSPGPVLFHQKRYGFNNQLIDVLKFRTMRHDQCDANGSSLTTPDDPRITRLGRFLRRSSLDELPQLINVLRGEMSIVGPRPHPIEAKAANRLYQDVVAGYAARHKVKPGLTGWAQVNGWRGPTDTEDQIIKRIEYDLWYLDNWSLFLDLRVMILTIFVGLFGKNAY